MLLLMNDFNSNHFYILIIGPSNTDLNPGGGGMPKKNQKMFCFIQLSQAKTNIYG